MSMRTSSNQFNKYIILFTQYILQLTMKKITIKAKDFFELLKLKGESMWDIFAQIIDGEEKEITFINDQDEYLFHYILPTTKEKLLEDKEIFSKEYADKLSGSN